MFDHLPDQHKDAFVADAAGYSHFVSDDDDGVIVAKAGDEFLNGVCRSGVECRARFVHENDARLEGEQTGDTFGVIADPFHLEVGFDANAWPSAWFM